MKKLMDVTLRSMVIYAMAVLIISIPFYYFIMSSLWEYELDEHKIILTEDASQEDSILIVSAVTTLTVFFTIVLFIGFVYLNRKLSARLWQPFYRTLTQIKTFRLGSQENVEFSKSNIAEFEELNDSLGKLIKTNIESFKAHKEFVDNAAHELQTPLGLVQSKLEMFIQNESISKEQYDFIEDVLNSLSRINRINRNLLLLTKIENSQYSDQEDVDVSEVLQAIVTHFNELNTEGEIVVESIITPGVIVNANRTLVEIMLSNLISNAFRHNTANGIIIVNLSRKMVQIANSGEESLDESKLYKRFGTASKNRPGTGLGLSLVKQIAGIYHWKEKYIYQSNLHIFQIEF